MLVLDQHCTQYSGAEVVDPYDCTLNQTDLKTNKNKFYIMQVINNGSSHYLYIRYGRIGEIGRISYASDTESTCISKFKTQFKSKTKNNWDDRGSFKQYAGKYYLCQKQKVDDSEIKKDREDEPKIPPSKLSDRLQSFLQLIGDINMLKTTLKSLDVDINKMPLGAISPEQLDEAESVLMTIQGLLQVADYKTNDQALNDKLVDLSSEYYTYVPQIVSRSSKPPLINSQIRIDDYMNRIEDLKNLKIAYSAVHDISPKMDHNPCDMLYSKVKTDIQPLSRDHPMWQVIEDFVFQTHGPTHHAQVKLVDIYEICREADRSRGFLKELGGQNVHLLWHGTRLSNYISIFQNGLVLRPEMISNAKITGKMFGYGIYGANSFSKSFNYCCSSPGEEACLFLGEFALGNQLERANADYNLNEKTLRLTGHHSCWGHGKWTPNKIQEVDGLKVPNGKLEKSLISHCALLYDEFIVYNEVQVKLKYVVRVKSV